jgi:hypothetical protein
MSTAKKSREMSRYRAYRPQMTAAQGFVDDAA